MEKKDFSKVWSIKGRSLEKSLVHIEKRTIEGRKGYINKPIFPFISFHESVVDLLHLTLRITDKLFKLLIYRLEELDATFSTNLVEILKKFFEIECRITNPFFLKENHLKLRKLNQNERIKIYKEFYENMRTLASIFPLRFQEDATILSLSKLIPKFFQYLNEIKKTESFSTIKKRKLMKKLKNWLEIFVEIEPKITPYIHIFVFHVPEFLELYPNLNQFSMQSLEKKNHLTKLNFFFRTNRKSGLFSMQLLKMMNRLDIIKLKSS